MSRPALLLMLYLLALAGNVLAAALAGDALAPARTCFAISAGCWGVTSGIQWCAWVNERAARRARA